MTINYFGPFIHIYIDAFEPILVTGDDGKSTMLSHLINSSK